MKNFALKRKKQYTSARLPFCRVSALLLAIVILCIQTVPCFAAESDLSESSTASVPMESGTFSSDETIPVTYYDTAMELDNNFTVPYSDTFFARDPDVFYMDLAQASFGMTCSAFRAVEDETTPRDQNAVAFFSNIGFENCESYWYEPDPTEDSISNVIAEKELDGETIIAFSCNGVDYGKEWLSNLTVGTGQDHEGFSAAADLCEERLMAYIEEHEITGSIKLWISGFSRSAAVGNCLAARMIESGLFTDVYGYFFATPNNTREPVAYPNLFNIIGQTDAVPWIPFSCWGYGHYGVDLYLPAQESNSGYYEKFQSADEIYSEIRGESFHNNPELNRQLYVIEQFVCVIFPTVEEFAEKLQPQLLTVLGQDSDQDLLSALREAIGNIQDLTGEQQAGVDALIDYLDLVIYQYISGNYSQISDGSWRVTTPLSQNLFFEHMAHVYGAWLLSTQDPAALFVEDTGSLHLVIKGSFDLEIWDDYGIVQSVSCGNEEVIYEPGSENRSEDCDTVCLYASNHDGSAVVAIPSDRYYSIRLYARETGDISLFSDSYSYQSRSDASDILLFHAQKDQCILLSDLFAQEGMTIQTESGRDIPILRQTMPAGISSLIAREKLTSGSFTVEQVLYAITFFLLMPMLLLLAALIVSRRGRRRGSRKAGTVVTMLFAACVLVLASGAVIFRMLLPNIPAVTCAYAGLAAAGAVITILKARRQAALRRAEGGCNA